MRLFQMPKLTPLQSRLLASTTALALILLTYWSLWNPHFAYAAELSLEGSGQRGDVEDHNWRRIEDGMFMEEQDNDFQALAESTGVLGGSEGLEQRATSAQISGNNIGFTDSFGAGASTIWEYPSSLLTVAHADFGVGLPGALSRRNSLQVEHSELRRRTEQDGLEERQDQTPETTIFISANTCSQPMYVGTGTQDAAPPQLTLYVSTVAGNQNVGPSGQNQNIYPFDGGFVNASVKASGDWYMAVSSPQLSTNFSGTWNYQLAASIDDYFYASGPDDDPFLFLVDTDSDSALLVTNNLTQANPSEDVYKQWVDLPPPFIIFATDQNLTRAMGLENSFCGLQTITKEYGQIQASQTDTQGNQTHVRMDMITRGLGNKPKEQFYVSNLNLSSPYTAYLAINGNSTKAGNGTVGGGGKVWGAGVNFTTKSDGNCQLLFGLETCGEVAYAVPANPKTANFSQLQAFYENYTSTWYPLFDSTLRQVACNTSSDARYSLARDCSDCAAAYKEWLCAVSIPRCEDFSNPAPYLQIRNVGQPFYANNSMLDDSFLSSPYVPMLGAPTLPGSPAFQQTYASSFATNRSRNLMIDATLQPGPYKEVLPCEDLCYSLMQSCPASLGFACPYPGRGLEASYGKRDASSGDVTCSYLGAVYYLNAAPSAAAVSVCWRAIVVALGLTMALSVM